MMRALLLLLVLTLVRCSGEPGPSSVVTDAGSSTSTGAFATQVVTVTYGTHAGYGQMDFPDVVLGPPKGGGRLRGGTEVLSLGKGGTITLQTERDIVDGEGPDFTVFENPFQVGNMGQTFAEPAMVEVSLDGESFTAFPCSTDGGFPYPGCAGVQPVLAPGDDGGISPFDPAVSGGDLFDLATIGVARARFIRITDVSPFNQPANNAGFDLDAVAVIHSASP